MPRKFPLFVYSHFSYRIFSVSTTFLFTLNFQSIYIIETSSKHIWAHKKDVKLLLQRNKSVGSAQI